MPEMQQFHPDERQFNDPHRKMLGSNCHRIFKVLRLTIGLTTWSVLLSWWARLADELIMEAAKKKTRTSSKREKNYATILDAAEQLFAANGYDGASMSNIAQAAEVPKANVLYYFKSKEILYQEVLNRILSAWNLGLDGLSEKDDPALVLGDYIEQKVRQSCAAPHQNRLFATEIIRGAPVLASHLKTAMRPWFREKALVIQAWIDQGKIQCESAEHLLFMIWATTQHYAEYQSQILILLNRMEYEAQDIDQMIAMVKGVILRGIGLHGVTAE